MAPEICFTFHTGRAATPLPLFIRNIIADFPLSYNLREEENRISLQVGGPEAELAALADALGRELPLSILLTGSEITAAAEPLKPPPERPVAAGASQPPLPTAADLPPCPRCLAQAETNFRAGLTQLTASCTLCGRQATEAGPLTGLFPPAQTQCFNNPAGHTTLFSQAAQYLAAGHPLNLDSPQNVGLIATVKPQGPIARVLVTDPIALPLFWQCGDDELLLLAALEKPLVRLEPSQRALDEYKLSSRPLAVGLADELFYWYLGRHLQEAGVPLLFLSNAPATANRGGARLSWGEPRSTPAVSSSLGRPLMLVLERQRWLLSGRRGLPPIPPSPAAADPGSPTRHLQGYRGFLATTPVSTEARDKLFGISLLPGPQGLALLTGNHRQSAMLLAISAPEKARPTREILKTVAALDEAAQRLCRNYAARFPRRWQALQQDPKPWRLDDLAQLGALVARLAGGGAEDDSTGADAAAADSGQLFLELAATMVPGRSPRLELAGTRENEVGDLHHLLRSTMSYALAGATPAAICRGCLESLAERLATMIWSHCGPDHQPRVALCSELALHPAFLAAIRRQGGPDFLLTPPLWPLDALPALAETAEQGQLEKEPSQLAPDDDRRTAIRSLFGLLGSSNNNR